MTIKLKRNNILYIGIAIIAIYLILNRVDYIFNGNITTGYVVDEKVWVSADSTVITQTAPIISFNTNSEMHTFQGEINSSFDIGEKVQVIYKTENPSKAKVYNFTGFWLTPIIYCLIPLILIAAAIFTFLKKTDVIVLEIGKRIKISKRDISLLSKNNLNIMLPEK